ncbi:MAG: hypothetical protein LBP95_02225 [Deltaproteobacteria bacterium]|jgi:phosphoserine phosphatase|nr:hypothetical protein [Deltaproteobacteria bacterium]
MLSDREPGALALDLDGTLLATDSLWEMFFRGLALGGVRPILWLFCGRLAFKRNLARTVELDLDLLPWNPEVVRLAEEHKAAGGEVWLATAANERMAARVAGYFPFFSGYMATDDKVNLKSRAKAAELVRRFGEGGFAYAGDSGADVAVWRASGRAIVVGGQKLAARALPIGGRVDLVEPVGTRRITLSSAARAAGAGGWGALFWVFLPLVWRRLFSLRALEGAALAFLALGFLFVSVRVFQNLLGVAGERAAAGGAGTRLKNDAGPAGLSTTLAGAVGVGKKLGIFAAGRLDLSRGGLIALGCLAAGLVLASLVSSGFAAAAVLSAAVWLVSRGTARFGGAGPTAGDILFMTGCVAAGSLAVSAFTGPDAAPSVWLVFFALALSVFLSLVGATARGAPSESSPEPHPGVLREAPDKARRDVPQGGPPDAPPDAPREISPDASPAASPGGGRAAGPGGPGRFGSPAFILAALAALVDAAVLGLAASMNLLFLQSAGSPVPAGRLFLLFCPVLFFWQVLTLCKARVAPAGFSGSPWFPRDKASWVCLALGAAVYYLAFCRGGFFLP